MLILIIKDFAIGDPENKGVSGTDPENKGVIPHASKKQVECGPTLEVGAQEKPRKKRDLFGLQFIDSIQFQECGDFYFIDSKGFRKSCCGSSLISKSFQGNFLFKMQKRRATSPRPFAKLYP